MFALRSVLAYDREQVMVAALAALVVAGVVVALGAWLLFFRERRHAAEPRTEEGGEEAELTPVTRDANGEERER